MKLLLIGAGNMGAAMLKGLSKYDILVVEKNKQKIKELEKIYTNVKITDEMPSIDEYIVILAIKPNTLPILELKGVAKGLISILAGVSLELLKQKIQAKSYVRAMPNMAALKQKSATTLCGDLALKDEAMQILSSIGKCFWLDSENELDIAMGINGCAPAWLFLVAEALSDGAVNLGLKREISYKLISALFEGVGEVLQDEHPAVLKDKVTSPKGTTIAGIKELEKKATRDAFMNAMSAAYNRSKNM